MASPAQPLCFLLLWLPGSEGEIVLTQSPTSLPVSLGERVTIKCKASQSLLHSDGNTYLEWFQQKPGKSIKALIYGISNLHSGVPSRFSGSGSGTDFTLTINNLESEDVADYFCGQDSQGEVVLTQSPASVSVSLGERVTIKCKASQSLLHSDGNNYLYWFQQKQDRIKALIYRVSNLHSGIPPRFSGSGSGTDFTLTISSLEAEDAAIYYCGQDTNWPPTQCFSPEQKPPISFSPDSEEELFSPES
ncbi:immunoglobulin kappa light chain-like [Monodelphis domestica]|uniref:immunoglobulin kappa light chain-like n=1 Tax=Monodelphis domestica TaxID=13616 RepID=UPI0024E1CF39|nr:immunoglobulin kappa light chain-like [Monodelphis domestica]